MISISFDHFLTLYICVLAVVLGVAWGRDLWRNSAQAWNVSEEALCRCRACGYIFVSKRIENLTRCPTCNELTRFRPKKSAKKLTY